MSDKQEQREALWTGITLFALVAGFSLTGYSCEAFGQNAPKKKESVFATGFATPGDKWAGTWFFCLRNRDGSYYRVNHTTPGIAHRWRKCGSKVKITNRRTGKSVITTVIDRGPYWLVPDWCAKDKRDRRGFRFASVKCWKLGRPAKKVERRSRPAFGWVYANGADITPPTRKAIGHNGFEPVDLEWQ